MRITGKVKDLTGQRFGKLTVIERDNTVTKGAAKWVCRCDCGNTVSVLAQNLKSGAQKSCGCNQGRVKDLTGQKFGKLTVIERDNTAAKGGAKWICRCDCGNTVSVYGTSLRSGKTKSCGCIRGKNKKDIGKKSEKITEKIQRDIQQKNRKPQDKIVPNTIYKRIEVIEPDTDSKSRLKTWQCRCLKCGKTFSSTGQDIFKYEEDGCPECRKNIRNEKREKDAEKYVGQCFGNLEAIGVAGLRPAYGRTTVFMSCICKKCGSITDIPLVRLKAGGASECSGCAKENLKLGHNLSQAASVEGTSVFAIYDRAINKNNQSGYKGVSWSKISGKWRAYINFRRKQYHLGIYDRLEDAVQARKMAEEKIYGDFLDWYAVKYPEQWKKINKKQRQEARRYDTTILIFVLHFVLHSCLK